MVLSETLRMAIGSDAGAVSRAIEDDQDWAVFVGERRKGGRFAEYEAQGLNHRGYV